MTDNDLNIVNELDEWLNIELTPNLGIRIEVYQFGNSTRIHLNQSKVRELVNWLDFHILNNRLIVVGTTK